MNISNCNSNNLIYYTRNQRNSGVYECIGLQNGTDVINNISKMIFLKFLSKEDCTLKIEISSQNDILPFFLSEGRQCEYRSNKKINELKKCLEFDLRKGDEQYITLSKINKEGRKGCKTTEIKITKIDKTEGKLETILDTKLLPKGHNYPSRINKHTVYSKVSNDNQDLLLKNSSQNVVNEEIQMPFFRLSNNFKPLRIDNFKVYDFPNPFFVEKVEELKDQVETAET